MNIITTYKFDENIFREQAEMQFDLSSAGNKDEKHNYKIFIILLFVGGILFLSVNADGAGIIAGPLMLIFGFIYLFIYINYLSKIKKVRKLYLNKIDEISQNYSAEKIEITNEITDYYFRHSDKDSDIKLNWKHFKSFMRIGDFLFLVLNEKEFSAYHLNRHQIGLEKFDELLNFLPSKLSEFNVNKSYPKKSKLNSELIDDTHNI